MRAERGGTPEVVEAARAAGEGAGGEMSCERIGLVDLAVIWAGNPTTK